jgi:hypothetical protein
MQDKAGRVDWLLWDGKLRRRLLMMMVMMVVLLMVMMLVVVVLVAVQLLELNLSIVDERVTLDLCLRLNVERRFKLINTF